MSDTLKKCPINLTPGAVKELLSILNDSEEKLPLRVGVKNGGCSGFSYILNFEEKKFDDDEYLLEGISIIINPLHLLHIENLEIDFEQGLNNRGFTYNNPNADTTCGCGTSFG